MRFRNVYRLTLIALFAVAMAGCGSSNSSSSGALATVADPFRSAVVRIADLETVSQGAFSNIGTDTLAAGAVQVKEDEPGQVRMRVTGAQAASDYGVQFCSRDITAANCFAVGTLTTDMAGNANTRLTFPQHGVFAGVFLFTRNNQNQFATAVTLALTPRDDGMGDQEDQDEDENDFEADLQPASAVTGGLGSAFGSAGTDTLKSGRVELENENENENDGGDGMEGESDNIGENQAEGPLEIKLNGAAAGVTYSAQFCRLGVDPSKGCTSLGSVSTDAQGNGHAEMPFPITGVADGIFLLSRSVNGATQVEFVSAISM